MIWRKLKWLIREFFSACWEVIKLPFWMIKVGWLKLISFGPKRIGIVLGATIIVFVVVLVTFVEATSQPDFCNTCHVMQPYYEAWKTSSHSHIACTECHIQPGIQGTVRAKFMALSMVANYLTGVYKRSKPWAEIEDSACLREGCHDTRLLKGKVNFKGVVFDHKPHLEHPRRDRQLRCTSCHAQIVQGEHISVTETTCFICHFKPDATGKWSDLARCTHCHTPPTGLAAADTSYDHTNALAKKMDCASCHSTTISGDGAVSKDRCNSCHAKQEHIEKFSDLDFVHRKHVTEHKVECTSCHAAIKHGKEAMMAEDPSRKCEQCHGGADNAISKVYNGTLPGLPVAPNPMAKVGMTCVSCHAEPIHKTAGTKHNLTCIPCHTENYNNLWRLWETPLQKAVANLENKIDKLDDPSRVELKQALDIYKSGNPIHNPNLVQIFESKLGGANKVTIGNCAVCHPAALDASPLYKGKHVNHRLHMAAVGKCESCHESEEPRHGAIKLSSNQCNSCHHESAIAGKQECASCHTVQAKTFAGESAYLDKSLPSAMKSGGVECIECHSIDKGNILRAVKVNCVSCHEASYADTLTVWQAEGDSLARKIQENLRLYNPGTDIYEHFRLLSMQYYDDGSKMVHNPEMFIQWAKIIQPVTQ